MFSTHQLFTGYSIACTEDVTKKSGYSVRTSTDCDSERKHCNIQARAF